MSRFHTQTSSKDTSQETWKKLEAGVDKIMNKLQDGMNMLEYMELYTSVHNFCTAQKPVSSGGLGASNHNRGGAHLLGEELYNHLTTYLNGHLEVVQEESLKYSGEELLRYYIREWKRYTTAAEYNNHLFRYLNRHWVKREMDEGKKNVYDIYTLHLVRWKEVMFLHCHSYVMDAVLKLVEKQRDGETIDHMQIKTLVQSFVSLGLDDSDTNKNNLEVYRQYFENPFLKATHEYYENESKRFLAENSVVEYMKKAETRLEEERERVDLYLLPDIQQPLMRTCENALIKYHSGILREEFQVLLDNDKLDDLARMYRLLSRIPEGLVPLRSRFEQHVKNIGTSAVEKIAVDGETIDPKTYVTTLLGVHLQYRSLVEQAFEGEADFVKSLDNACRAFVNQNKVCNGSQGKSSRTPELLSKYADSLMKRSGAKMSEEDDMEKCQGEVMTIFKYIDDKDVFQTFYRRALSKRLVQGTSSEDHETSMISKLKETCGFEYTNKLQRMFQDVQISKDLNSQYRDWVANIQSSEDTEANGKSNGSGLDSYFMVLASGMWPMTTGNTPFSPPPILQKVCERFVTFYQGKHNGRKLSWLWNMGKGEIRCNFAKYQGKHPYLFTVSAYQMAILLLFQDSDTDTLMYEQIMAATQLNKEHLDPQLRLFLKAKLLTSSVSVEDEPTEATTYTLNRNYKNKKVKVNLNVPMKSEARQEVEETQKNIEEDRKLLIQSAIVRVMKSRKKLKHQNLVSETISLIKNRFAPKVSEIKKCVEILIEKEYLERLDDDMIGYVA